MGWFKHFITLCLALVALFFIFGAFSPRITEFFASKIKDIPEEIYAHWGRLGIHIIYVAGAIWALFRYRSSMRWRALFLSIAILAVLMFSSEVLTKIKPGLDDITYYTTTILGWSFGILFAVGLILDARSRKST